MTLYLNSSTETEPLASDVEAFVERFQSMVDNELWEECQSAYED